MKLSLGSTCPYSFWTSCVRLVARLRTAKTARSVFVLLLSALMLAAR